MKHRRIRGALAGITLGVASAAALPAAPWNPPEPPVSAFGFPIDEPDPAVDGRSALRATRLTTGVGVTAVGALMAGEGLFALVAGAGVLGRDGDDIQREGALVALSGLAVTGAGIFILTHPWGDEGGWGGLYETPFSLRLHPSGRGATIAFRF